VEAVMPDSNNLVRRVKVRTAQSTLVRDIRKLCFLESLVVEDGLLNNNYGLFEHNELPCCTDQL